MQKKSVTKMVKLPKTLRWMCAEWFTSNLDGVCFENEFEQLVSDFYPLLATRMLRRKEWNVIRRKFGKKRRFSSGFIRSEMEQLGEKRKRIRTVLQRKTTEFGQEELTGLPERLPAPVTVGQPVVAIDFQSNEGAVALVSGTLQGIDMSQNLYRVLLDGPRKPTHSPDENDEDIAKMIDSPAQTLVLKSFKDCDVSTMGDRKTISRSSLPQKSRGRSWLFTTLSPNKLSTDTKKQRRTSGPGIDMVQRLNMVGGKPQVKDPRCLDLITKLTSLMVQIQLLGDDNVRILPTEENFSRNRHQLAALRKSLNTLKNSIDPSNLNCFSQNVDKPLSKFL